MNLIDKLDLVVSSGSNWRGTDFYTFNTFFSKVDLLPLEDKFGIDLNSSSITGNGNINITGDIVCTNEMTANVVNGNFHGSLFGDVFADDSTTILVDATLQQFNGNLVGPLATNTITSNSTLDIDVSGSLNLNVSADVFIKREGNSVLYCVNNQPTQDLSAPGVFHGIIGVKTIDVNGENTSVILGAGSDGFSISKTDAAYALPNSNKLFIGTDGKFGFGTITPTEKFDFESGHPIFTSEIESIMLASKGVKSRKNKKEVKNDLLSNMAPLKGQIKNKNIQVILCNFTA